MGLPLGDSELGSRRTEDDGAHLLVRAQLRPCTASPQLVRTSCLHICRRHIWDRHFGNECLSDLGELMPRAEEGKGRSQQRDNMIIDM
jgi:hypothetical protein